MLPGKKKKKRLVRHHPTEMLFSLLTACEIAIKKSRKSNKRNYIFFFLRQLNLFSLEIYSRNWWDLRELILFVNSTTPHSHLNDEFQTTFSVPQRGQLRAEGKKKKISLLETGYQFWSFLFFPFFFFYCAPATKFRFSLSASINAHTQETGEKKCRRKQILVFWMLWMFAV